MQWCPKQVRLLEGPDLQAVDAEILLGGERLVVEGGTFGGGAPIQLRVKPQTQLATAQGGGGGKESKRAKKWLIY